MENTIKIRGETSFTCCTYIMWQTLYVTTLDSLFQLQLDRDTTTCEIQRERRSTPRSSCILEVVVSLSILITVRDYIKVQLPAHFH
jgi:hypothetical protein